jgi:hypothetical protein
MKKNESPRIFSRQRAKQLAPVELTPMQLQGVSAGRMIGSVSSCNPYGHDDNDEI